MMIVTLGLDDGISTTHAHAYIAAVMDLPEDVGLHFVGLLQYMPHLTQSHHTMGNDT